MVPFSCTGFRHLFNNNVPNEPYLVQLLSTINEWSSIQTCVHVWHREVNGLLPLRRDGQVDDSHVCFLEKHEELLFLIDTREADSRLLQGDGKSGTNSFMVGLFPSYIFSKKAADAITEVTTGELWVLLAQVQILTMFFWGKRLFTGVAGVYN